MTTEPVEKTILRWLRIAVVAGASFASSVFYAGWVVGQHVEQVKRLVSHVQELTTEVSSQRTELAVMRAQLNHVRRIHAQEIQTRNP